MQLDIKQKIIRLPRISLLPRPANFFFTLFYLTFFCFLKLAG